MEAMDRVKQFEESVYKVMECYGAAGMAVSLFCTKHVRDERFFRYRDAEAGLSMDENTICGMASVSKSFTALAIMQMAEQKLLVLTDPVSRYLPQFKDTRVTISHLLSHSGGYFPLKRLLVRDIADGLGIYENGKRELGYDPVLAKKGLEEVCNRLNRQTKRLGKPGQYMSYCNDGYGILSELIHLYGGEASYGEYIKKHILEPLGMTRSFCEFVRPAEDENGTELYIHRNGRREHSRDFYDNAFVLMGGGAVKSTLCDMKRYVQMYLRNGEAGGGQRLISRESIQEMCRPRQEYHYGQWYGYGLAEKRIGSLTIWGHGGSLTGISNHMAWEPRLGVGVLVLCNTTGVPASYVADMAFRLHTGLPLEEPEPAPVIAWSRTLQEKAAGSYRSGEGVHVVLEARENGMGLLVGGAVTGCRMLLPGVLTVETLVGSDDLMLMTDDDGEVFGVRFRGRILSREK